MRIPQLSTAGPAFALALILASCASTDEPCVGDACNDPCVGDECDEPFVGDACEAPIAFPGCAVIAPPVLTTVSGAHCGETWDEALGVGDVFQSMVIDDAVGSFSSARAFDVNGDGCADILSGSVGAAHSPIIAVDGRTNEPLWTHASAGEIFGSPTAMTDADGALQLLFAGRDGTLVALGASDGELRWAADIDCFRTGEHLTTKNFYNPIVVEDLTEDGVGEIVVVYGGDPDIDAYEDRPSSFVLLLDGATGEVLASRETPDLAESYTSVTRVTEPGCGADERPETSFLIGTGGETHRGALFHLPLRELMTHNWCEGIGAREAWGTSIARGDNLRGFIAPAAHVDLNGDGVDDILIASAGGGLHALDGGDFAELWHHNFHGEETSATPTVARQAGGSDVVGWGVLNGVFPHYTKSVLRIVDASTGEVLTSREDPFTYVSSLLAVDLDNDGNDELLFTLGSYTDNGRNGLLAIYDVARDNWDDWPLPVRTHGTPVIRRYGEGLELIVAGNDSEGDPTQALLTRILLSKVAPTTLTWPEYLGDCHDGRGGCAGR